MPIQQKKDALRKKPQIPAMTADMPSSTRVLRQFRVVINAVKVHFRQVEKVAGIGGAQLWALGLLESHPNMSVNDLAQAMDVHQSTASNLVKLLIAQEMVSTNKLGEDRRLVKLSILPKGSAVLNKAPAPFSGVLPDALASLDEHTLLRLEHDLATLITVLRADESAANTPLAD